MYFVIAAEARRVGIPFGGHVVTVTPIEASDSGASITDHLFAPADDWPGRCWGAGASVERCQPVAEHFGRNGTWLAPTLVVYKGYDGTYARPIMARFIERAHAFWIGAPLHDNWLRDSANSGTTGTTGASHPDSGAMHIMQQVGLPILAGTDSPTFMPELEWKDLRSTFFYDSPLSSGFTSSMAAGFSLHVELAMYVAEGLTPLAALQTATINPAKVLHATDSLGTVAAGKLADLVLLDANPLEDITNTTMIRGVVANGRYYDRAALDGLLTEVQAEVAKLPP
jgi:hypothetical protein